MTLKSFFSQHRNTIIDFAVLLVVVAVCVPLLVVVPDSRPYAATFIAWALAFTFHLWRWLPSERRHVRRTAHRCADALMQARGVGKVHRYAKSLQTTTAWSISEKDFRVRGSHLLDYERNGDADAVVEEEDSFAYELTEAAKHKFLPDSGDSTNSLCCFLPRRSRNKMEEDDGSWVATSPAPLLHISAAALESSSQFLALSATASPTRPSLSPALHDSASVMQKEEGPYVHRSHEPFTHVSQRLSSTLSDTMTSPLSPVLSAIAADHGIKSPPPSPSLSPASSCRMHGYMPRSHPSTIPALLPVLREDCNNDCDGGKAIDTLASASRTSSMQSPSRISILSSNVRRQDGLTLVPRGGYTEG